MSQTKMIRSVDHRIKEKKGGTAQGKAFSPLDKIGLQSEGENPSHVALTTSAGFAGGKEMVSHPLDLNTMVCYNCRISRKSCGECDALKPAH